MASRVLLLGAAIAMLLSSGVADAQAGKAKVIKPKAPVVSPIATPAPNIVQDPRVVKPQRDVEAAAYSDLVNDVSESLDQFSDDNVSENKGRDHLGDSGAEESADDAGSETKKKPRR